MTDDLSIRPAGAEDVSRMLELVSLSLGRGPAPRHEAFWRWKHVENPFGPSPALLAEAGGILVGLRVFMRWVWHAHGSAWPAVRAVDTATHPAWRGRGIFSRLTRELVKRVEAEGAAFVFNTPNGKSRPGYLKMGWSSLGRTSVWIRPSQPLKLAHHALFPGRAAPRGEDGAAERPPAGTPFGDLLGRPELPAFLDTLPRDATRFSTARTVDYLNWRYGNVPDLEYRAAWDLAGGDGALIVFRCKERGEIRELRLCEVLLGGSARAETRARDLIRSVVSRAAAAFATGLAPGAAQRRVLLRAGFVPAVRAGPTMTVRPLRLHTGAPDPLRRAAWRLSAGDLELF